MMKPRDLNFIPESVGGKEPQPAGSHIHDRIRTGTVVGKPLPLLIQMLKLQGRLGMVMILDYPMRQSAKFCAHLIIMQR